jgi:putative ABC transport system ATP-binding protein
VREVNLEARSGEFIAIVGRSGCGKTTLLNLLGAMDVPTSGTVLLAGHDTRQLTDDELTRLRRRHVGFVFQFFNLLPTLTVVENAEMPLILDEAGDARNIRERALSLLDQVGLPDRADDFPHRLSGGEMQRVAIARALVHRPRLIIADEPTGNLDSISADYVLNLMRRLCSETNTAVVLATHSADAASVSDRVIHMQDGRLTS